MSIIMASLVLLPGCSYIKSMKTFAPELFGMEKITEHVYVNPQMSIDLREKLLESIKASKDNIVSMYGAIQSTPDIIACSTEACYGKFGGATSRAKNYGGFAFLLSPRGITTPLITHEWSHNEFYTRLDSFWAYRKIPQWFDEGLAVVASNEPGHSEDVWQYIVRHNIPKPTLDELVSLDDWYKAVSVYGGQTAKEDQSKHIKVVYATAGHEVREWYKCAESSGVLELIHLIQSGNEFAGVYESIKNTGKC